MYSYRKLRNQKKQTRLKYTSDKTLKHQNISKECKIKY